MKKLFFVATMLISLSVFAGLKSKDKSRSKITGPQSLAVSVDQGFHFNIEAPTFVKVLSSGKKLSPTVKKEKELIFSVDTKDTKDLLVSYYVCDDKKTVCEPHEDRFVEGATAKAELKSTAYEKALAKAKKKDQLILIDFAAKWCPPCIRLEHEVFPTKVFQAAIKNYVFLTLDVDKEENFAVMEKYGIKAFPTLVVINSEGEELARFLDFQEAHSFAQNLTQINKNRPQALTELKQKAQGGDAAASLALAEAYYKALNYPEAVTWFEKANVKTEHFHESKIATFEDEGGRAYQKALTEAFEKYPDYFFAVDWRISLAKTYDKDLKKMNQLLEEAKLAAQQWIQHPQLMPEIAGLEVSEMWSKVAEIESLLKNDKASKEAWNKAVEAAAQAKPSVQKPMHMIYLIAYMKEVKDLKEIEPLILKLEKAYPHEFTYVQRHAKLLLDKGEAKRALPVAQKAFNMSYGWNRLNIGLLLAKIHKELGDKEKAKTVLDELLSDSQAQASRNKKIVKSISDYREGLMK